ncbi:MAG TPA: tetratricopeptide repeat protein [Chthonomonadaceae bacterium]|nr:tetratricopeptide repeat protein [Chthonomonadaceae bacterium]
MNIPWTIQLFGGLCACNGPERTTRFASRKVASLLAYLAYHRDRPHSREALIEFLWPECDPATGRNRLNNLLSLLRRLLEPPGTPAGSVVQADHSHVRLSPEVLTTDVADFERLLLCAGQAAEGAERIALLQEACSRYRNGLLPGFYEDWVLQEQQRLSERYVEALQELAWNQQQTGALKPALEAVDRALRVDPYREALYRLQMRLYAALGQPAAAQQSYQTLERLFREELGVTPSAATRQLAEQIRQNPRSVVGGRERAAKPAGGAEGASASSDPIEKVEAPAAEPRSSGAPLTNLPVSLTRFFGREAQVAQLQAWLTDAEFRLITLTGPGGAGKTRLAVESARQAAPAFGNRVWFVDLAALQDGRLLPFTLAHTLQVAPEAHTDPLKQVVQKLQGGPSLLLLDNFEHLLRPRAEPTKSERPISVESVLLLRLLLEQAPELTCLVTSRRPLCLGGEQELSIPALAAPPAGDTPERLLDYASVALYVDRARAARPEFALTEKNAEAVAALCRRLEGLPLAIEMAAAWTRTLLPAKMLERLEQRLDLLVSRRRDLPPRQQSLRATLEWSYDLLEPEGKRCFAHLSVFRGGFRMEAVEAVCGEGAISALLALQEGSLVSAEEAGEDVRYRMLESTREFAAEMLTESGEREAVERRHAEYFLALAEEAEPHLTGPEPEKWLQRLEADYANLRAVREWSVQTPERGERELRLCVMLMRFWQMRGPASEGRAWYAAALSRPMNQAATLMRAWALNGAGTLACVQSDYSAARAYFEESLAIRRDLGDRGDIAKALNNLGGTACYQGDHVTAQAYYEESLAIKREIGDKRGIASVFNNLGILVSYRGDYASAQAYHLECLAIERETGDLSGVSNSLHNLGNVAFELGDNVSAHAYYSESLAIEREIGDRSGIANALHSLGSVAFEQGDYEAARTFYEESLSLRKEVGDRRNIAAALSNLGGVAYYQGDYVTAYAHYEASLMIFRELGNWRYIATSLEVLADLALAQGQAERTARLLGAAERLREELETPLPPNERKEYDRTVGLSRQSLGDEAFIAAWEEGRQMPRMQTVAYALGEQENASSGPNGTS